MGTSGAESKGSENVPPLRELDRLHVLIDEQVVARCLVLSPAN